MTFQQTLSAHGAELTKGDTTRLQVNVGSACDLTCRHCHQEAGPARAELMSRETVEAVIACAGRFPFETIDITGGAPELQPHLPRLITALAPLTPKLVIRTNLVALARPDAPALIELYRQHRVTVVASLPSPDSAETDAVRGERVYQTSLEVLRRLNATGYGIDGSGLVLDIAVNPVGASLPESQCAAEKRFRTELLARHGISFNNLFTFANVPLGRFRDWLKRAGIQDDYLLMLKERFSPCTISRLMCRSLISVDREGYLFDCDFNLAARLPFGGKKKHISTLMELPRPGTPIAVGDHCHACTAGAGFTCGGSISGAAGEHSNA